ncbi:MAG: alpha/beta hydrolase [Candidatus Levybacteria bacterium]|nr:alpha/beta hydrolase [Candidatus Levybacteria bacterium]
MKFVIFHGAYGNPEGNWFPELKEKLEALGQQVIVPSFPTPYNQNLNFWLSAFEKVKKEFKRGEKLCFIGHSLGPLFILHLIQKYNLKLDSAIFVSPFLEKLGKPLFDKVNKTFYKNDFDFRKLKKLIPVSYTLYSNNDPYVLSKNSIDFAKKIDSSPIIVKGAGHMNSEFGFNKFPLIVELCKTRIELNSLQSKILTI